MWYLSIIVSIIIAIGLIIYLNVLFSKLNNEWKVFGGAGVVVNPFNILYPHLSIGNRFSNITSNIVLKTIVFIIISLIIHFTDSLTVTYIYILFVLLAWWVFNKRRKDLNYLSEENKKMFKHYVFNSYITIPIFQTILFLLCYITYLNNK
ncbi:MAG: hypothetical protein J6A49_10600 [Clostridia bacterium]|nr:hypothetical protein [Clostridia bacterium]